MMKALAICISLIFLCRLFLFSDNSITLYNLTNEASLSVNQGVLSVYVQKSSFRGLRSFLDHGGSNREFIFHKVARIDFDMAVVEGLVKTETVIENESLDSYQRFRYSQVSNVLLEQYCRDPYGYNGEQDCKHYTSETVGNKKVHHIYNLEQPEKSAFIVSVNGNKGQNTCHFRSGEFWSNVKKEIPVNFLRESDSRHLVFRVLPYDKGSLYTTITAKVGNSVKYYRITLKDCIKISDIKELEFGKLTLNNTIEKDSIRVLDEELYIAIDAKAKNSLLLIDAKNCSVKKIPIRRLDYFFDTSTRTLLFYDLDSENFPYDNRLYVDTYSIDDEKWYSKVYKVEFSYDRIIYNVREFLPVIF